MGASHLSAGTWVIVAVIAGMMVSLCLATVARIIRYERGLQELIEEVREIRLARSNQFPVGTGRDDVRRAPAPTARSARAEATG